MTEKEFHQYRQEIDVLIFKAENALHGDNAYGRELALVRTKLQEAKMWAGQCLAAFGSQLPEGYRDFADERERSN